MQGNASERHPYLGLLARTAALDVALHLLDDRREVELRVGVGVGIKRFEALVDELLVDLFIRARRRSFAFVLFHFFDRALHELLALGGVHLVEGFHHLLETGGQSGVEKRRLFGGGERAEKLPRHAAALQTLTLVVGHVVELVLDALDRFLAVAGGLRGQIGAREVVSDGGGGRLRRVQPVDRPGGHRPDGGESERGFQPEVHFGNDYHEMTMGAREEAGS